MLLSFERADIVPVYIKISCITLTDHGWRREGAWEALEQKWQAVEVRSCEVVQRAWRRRTFRIHVRTVRVCSTGAINCATAVTMLPLWPENGL